jgi:hypothetical protein
MSMRKLAFLSAQLLIGVVMALAVDAQSLKTTNADKETGPGEKALDRIISGDTAENGVFRSKSGNFSIAIPDFPKQIIDKATEKAKAKGVDVGKQFVWVFDRTLYTIFYNPPVDNDGDPRPQVYADMEIGSRKGIHNGGATLISEKPIALAKHRGTEFRYILPNGVRYIGRIYLVGEMGYQVAGGYADEQDEQTVLAVLDSFRPAETPGTPNAEPGPRLMRLNRSLGKLNEIASSGELEPRTKRFRMDIPFLKSRYSPPTAANPNVLQYQWDFEDAVVVVSVVQRQSGTFSNMSVAARKQSLADFLEKSMTSIGVQKLSEKDVSADFVVGKEVRIRRDRGIVTARSYIVGDMYVSISVATESAEAEAQVSKLFDSIKFLK